MRLSFRAAAVAGGLLAAAGLSAAVPASAENPPSNPNADLCLVILHHSDGESQLIDAGSGLENFGGIDRFATVVANARTDARRARTVNGERCRWTREVLLSSGDNFLAGPEFTASLNKGVPFYDSIALSRLRYDALAIGNHEFDFGPVVFRQFINGFRPPIEFLSANLDFSGEPGLQNLVNRGKIASSTVVQIGGRSVGIVGATTERLSFISSPRNVVVEAVLPAVQAEVDALRARGVSRIIFISHLQDLDEDTALIPLVRGIDVAIAGGGDELLANADDVLIPGDVAAGPYPLVVQDADGRNVPVLSTSGNYKYLGRLIVSFDAAGEISGIDTLGSGPIRVAGTALPDGVVGDPVIRARVVEPVAAAVAALDATQIGETQVALDGVRNNVRSRETNLGNLIADSLLWQAQQLAAAFGQPLPMVSLQNGGGIRNDDVPGPGTLSELDTFDILPFANFVSIVPNLPRQQFKAILENAVSLALPQGRFAQIGGFSYSYTLTGTAQTLNPDGTIATPGTRVQRVVLSDGTLIVDAGTVVPGAPITVASIDFLARGGDQYPFLGAPFTTVGVTYQQALRNYIDTALGGIVTAADYPAAGEGRITDVTPTP